MNGILLAQDNEARQAAATNRELQLLMKGALSAPSFCITKGGEVVPFRKVTKPAPQTTPRPPNAPKPMPAPEPLRRVAHAAVSNDGRRYGDLLIALIR